MGTLIKKTVTRPMPADAKIVTRKGKQIAQWTDRRKRKRSAEVTTGKDGTQRIKTEAATWTAKYRDGDGVVREVSTGCRDKQAAFGKLKELTDRAELVKGKVITSDQARIADHQGTPLVEHIDAYVQYLGDRKVNADRLNTTENRLKESATACGFRFLCDLNVDRLERWLIEQVNDDERKASAAVYNGYVELWVAFGYWCIGKRMTGKKSHMNGDKRLLANPFEGMGRRDAQADRRRKARALTEAELGRLLDAARRRPLLDAMTVRTGPNKGKPVSKVADHRKPELERLGHERALIYKTAVLTGLRADELRTLSVADLSFGDVPFVRLQRSNEKNRQGSTLPIRDDLAADLQAWVKDRKPGDRVFRVPDGLLRIMDRDLATAGIPKVDADGYVVHVHALRHSFGTHLSMAGVAPRVAQATMRHSDIKLTMGVYTDARLLDTAAAVASLPSLPLAPLQDNAGDLARMVAPTVAPNLGKQGKTGSFPDHCGDRDGSVETRKNPEKTNVSQGFSKSGRQDLNLRPLRPERQQNRGGFRCFPYNENQHIAALTPSQAFFQFLSVFWPFVRMDHAQNGPGPFWLREHPQQSLRQALSASECGALGAGDRFPSPWFCPATPIRIQQNGPRPSEKRAAEQDDQGHGRATGEQRIAPLGLEPRTAEPKLRGAGAENALLSYKENTQKRRTGSK
ncbi:MAG: site-specific integrase [Candidatus Paceibacterota bacterium]